MTVSGAERLRLGRSSGGNTAGLELVETAAQPSDDGCYENGKAWILERGWIWQMPRGLSRGSLLPHRFLKIGGKFRSLLFELSRLQLFR
jgi:hypothetical protein